MQALIDFEEVISLEPKNFMGEDFSRVTQIYRVAQYNIACCYSAIDQVKPLPVRSELNTSPAVRSVAYSSRRCPAISSPWPEMWRFQAAESEHAAAQLSAV